MVDRQDSSVVDFPTDLLALAELYVTNDVPFFTTENDDVRRTILGVIFSTLVNAMKMVSDALFCLFAFWHKKCQVQNNNRQFFFDFFAEFFDFEKII